MAFRCGTGSAVSQWLCGWGCGRFIIQALVNLVLLLPLEPAATVNVIILTVGAEDGGHGVRGGATGRFGALPQQRKALRVASVSCPRRFKAVHRCPEGLPFVRDWSRCVAPAPHRRRKLVEPAFLLPSPLPGQGRPGACGYARR